tara:strand:- start:781 stop:1884 length:1104 start_codon:yes stop_codon:yes gene_type:complete
MKVVILHPPMYPVNHEFYNILGEKCELIVYQFGEHPVHHTQWTDKEIREDNINYKLKVYGKGAVSLVTQINPSFIIELIKEKPSLVLSIAFWIPSFYASLLKKIIGFKFVILTNTISATENDLSYSKNIFRKLIAWNTDVFIAASQLTKEYLTELYPKNEIIQSVQTINVKKWNKEISQLPNKNLLREELNLPQYKKILLGVGNFTDKKNWISVLKQLDEIDNVLFVLIGYGVQKVKYFDLIKKLNIEDKVKIIGKKEGASLKQYYKASDIFIFPSKHDQFGFVVPEALATGLPVICTEFAGASSLIEDEENGFVVNPDLDFNDEINLIIKDLNRYKKNASSTMNLITLENRVYEFMQVFKKIIDFK